MKVFIKNFVLMIFTFWVTISLYGWFFSKMPFIDPISFTQAFMVSLGILIQPATVLLIILFSIIASIREIKNNRLDLKEKEIKKVTILSIIKIVGTIILIMIGTVLLFAVLVSI